ncbi:MAG: hypothetical protein LW645_02535 [Verrucomicrobiaceae bacterium]|jgi:hypothetical protein|nr:hypothetical protein [Verrucomicrobiaceae bacterium]
MDLGLSRKHIQKLAVDEIAVVFYIRLLLNIPLVVIAWCLLAIVADKLLHDKLASITGISGLLVMLLLWLAWTVWTLFIIRRELLQRPRFKLTHTPTFYSWARATQALAIISLMRPLLGGWFSTKTFETITGMAWTLSCLMACFYFVYFVLLLLVWQRPPYAIVRAFLLATLAASMPPPYLGLRSEANVQVPAAESGGSPQMLPLIEKKAY